LRGGQLRLMQVVMPSLGWRWLLTLSSVPLAVLLLFYKFVPESPRYLAAQGETTSAVKILQQMARVNQRSLPLGRLVVVGSEELQTLAQQRQQATQETMTEEEEEEEKIQFLLLVEDKGPPVLLHQVNKETSPIGGVLSSFTTLLSPPLISSTILLWSVFFANAFTYYGLVLLTSQLSGQGGGCDTDLVASSTAVASTSDNTQLYRDVFVSSIGELPGLAVAAAIVDKLGRKWSMAALFGMCGVFLLPLVHPQPENLTILFLFGGRACIMGAFTVLYIYAPEVYPTSTRSTGLGIANSFARVGGIVCPLVAVDLVRSCQQGLAVSVFAGVPLLAAVAVLFFPMETTGQPLSDVVDRSPAVGRK
jgi:MFS family permease